MFSIGEWWHIGRLKNPMPTNQKNRVRAVRSQGAAQHQTLHSPQGGAQPGAGPPQDEARDDGGAQQPRHIRVP